MLSMNTRLARIYCFLMSEGCSRVHAMALVCAEAGVKVADVAQAAGIGRGHLNMVLSGERPVREPAREAYKKLVGFDPWQF